MMGYITHITRCHSIGTYDMLEDDVSSRASFINCRGIFRFWKVVLVMKLCMKTQGIIGLTHGLNAELVHISCI